jgi:hypothetical protein
MTLLQETSQDREGTMHVLVYLNAAWEKFWSHSHQLNLIRTPQNDLYTVEPCYDYSQPPKHRPQDVIVLDGEASFPWLGDLGPDLVKGRIRVGNLCSRQECTS